MNDDQLIKLIINYWNIPQAGRANIAGQLALIREELAYFQTARVDLLEQALTEIDRPNRTSGISGCSHQFFNIIYQRILNTAYRNTETLPMTELILTPTDHLIPFICYGLRPAIVLDTQQPFLGDKVHPFQNPTSSFQQLTRLFHTPDSLSKLPNILMFMPQVLEPVVSISAQDIWAILEQHHFYDADPAQDQVVFYPSLAKHLLERLRVEKNHFETIWITLAAVLPYYTQATIEHIVLSFLPKEKIFKLGPPFQDEVAPRANSLRVDISPDNSSTTIPLTVDYLYAISVCNADGTAQASVNYNIGVQLKLQVPFDLHKVNPAIWVESFALTHDPRDQLMAGIFHRLLATPNPARMLTVQGPTLLRQSPSRPPLHDDQEDPSNRPLTTQTGPF